MGMFDEGRATYTCACCGWVTVVPHTHGDLCHTCFQGPEVCKRFLTPLGPDARTAALDFLRAYVHRGDSEQSIRQSHMGCGMVLYSAQVCGDRVLVTEVHKQPVEARFSLHSLYLELEREKAGQVRMPLPWAEAV